jgi:predicted transglutaminase-like cysteine proteinase
VRTVSKLKFARAAPWAALAALLFASALAATCQPGYSCNVRPGLIAHYAGRFGPGARFRLEGWREFGQANASRIAAAREGANEAELLALVNRHFNRLPAASDLALWGVEDYWATPAEFLSVGGGDCEDYTIAKYFTLKELGIPIARLRLVYAKISAPGPQSGHMVLAYYADPRADPLILDNLNASIQPASRRPDLVPVFSFNDDDLRFPGNDAMTVQMNVSSVRQWQVLTEKLVREMAY